MLLLMHFTATAWPQIFPLSKNHRLGLQEETPEIHLGTNPEQPMGESTKCLEARPSNSQVSAP
jgi:hypothetical protein